MVISHKWLNEYLPAPVELQKLSRILTAIGLEVESVEKYESIRGGLQSVVVGEVLTCEKHPDADKLKVTTVNVGAAEPLQIVCGASNVAVGQKVLAAIPGAVIYPTGGEKIEIRKAKIRGQESFGMICAEDELGLGDSHAGIMVLAPGLAPGTPASELFAAYSDDILEIGLTPNRMDAMSHLGTARDVCAWLRHHEKADVNVVTPYLNKFSPDNESRPFRVQITDPEICPRYCGLSISGVEIKPSPDWLRNKLKAIGVKPVNNVVDATNYILHESGQPLHAFDADRISGSEVIVRKAGAGVKFTTLDAKERSLLADDIVIADHEKVLCLAGVYGGADSGVTASTKNIFLESAVFSGPLIRRSSLAHNLRTDAAIRFEKNVDISQPAIVLKRAALLIRELAGGSISSDIIDVFPGARDKTVICLTFRYLKKLSGKNYHPDTVKNILVALGFAVEKENPDELWVSVPYSKSDITIPADVVEEIMRIDGLDNVEIPATMTIAPGSEARSGSTVLYNKVLSYLVGSGFHEIFTNSITSSSYYPESVIKDSVRMINSLSAELDMLRPSLLETGLEVIAYNSNRKNSNLKFFEFGKIYKKSAPDKYEEKQQLALFVTGNAAEGGWQQKPMAADFFFLKGLVEAIGHCTGSTFTVTPGESGGASIMAGRTVIGEMEEVSGERLKKFGLKEKVWFASLDWEKCAQAFVAQKTVFTEIPKFPAVVRDLAIVIDKSITFAEVETAIANCRLSALRSVKLFDIFESDKLGEGKQSLALNFVFSDPAKTLEDSETEAMMAKIVTALETSCRATIRK